MKHVRISLLFCILFIEQVACAQFGTPGASPGRPLPYFRNFTSHYLVKGVIVGYDICKTYHEKYSTFNVYSIRVKVLEDFGLGLNDTIILYPDTILYDNGDYYSWFYRLDNPLRDEEFYCSFYKNENNQECYNHFFIIIDGKVQGTFTKMEWLFQKCFGIYTKGIKPSRFERRVGHLLEKNNN